MTGMRSVPVSAAPSAASSVGRRAVQLTVGLQLLATQPHRFDLRQPRPTELERQHWTRVGQPQDRRGRTNVRTPGRGALLRLLRRGARRLQRYAENGNQKKYDSAPAASDRKTRSADGSLLRGQAPESRCVGSCWNCVWDDSEQRNGGTPSEGVYTNNAAAPPESRLLVPYPPVPDDVARFTRCRITTTLPTRGVRPRCGADSRSRCGRC